MMTRRYPRSARERPSRNPYHLFLKQVSSLGGLAISAYNTTKHVTKRVVEAASQGAAYTTPEQERHFFEENPDQMHQVVAQSHEILAGARTVILPINIFPDTITVDRMKVTINEQTFFWMRNISTMRIEDILNVSANLGLFFGSLTISSRVMNSTDHYEINGFWNKDVVRLKHIIQGYMIALHQGIDVSSLSTDRLIRKLNELGSDSAVVKY